MDISNLTIEQLKALAYDVISEAEKTQKNLQVINGEIAKKTEMERNASQPKSPTPEKENAPKEDNQPNKTK